MKLSKPISIKSLLGYGGVIGLCSMLLAVCLNISTASQWNEGINFSILTPNQLAWGNLI